MARKQSQPLQSPDHIEEQVASFDPETEPLASRHHRRSVLPRTHGQVDTKYLPPQSSRMMFVNSNPPRNPRTGSSWFVFRHYSRGRKPTSQRSRCAGSFFAQIRVQPPHAPHRSQVKNSPVPCPILVYDWREATLSSGVMCLLFMYPCIALPHVFDSVPLPLSRNLYIPFNPL